MIYRIKVLLMYIKVPPLLIDIKPNCEYFFQADSDNYWNNRSLLGKGKKKNFDWKWEESHHKSGHTPLSIQ